MKRKITTVLVVLSMLLCSSNAFAKSNGSDDWISQKLENYEPL